MPGSSNHNLYSAPYTIYLHLSRLCSLNFLKDLTFIPETSLWYNSRIVIYHIEYVKDSGSRFLLGLLYPTDPAANLFYSVPAP